MGMRSLGGHVKVSLLEGHEGVLCHKGSGDPCRV
jgi:hypothetical protein